MEEKIREILIKKIVEIDNENEVELLNYDELDSCFLISVYIEYYGIPTFKDEIVNYVNSVDEKQKEWDSYYTHLAYNPKTGKDLYAIENEEFGLVWGNDLSNCFDLEEALIWFGVDCKKVEENYV